MKTNTKSEFFNSTFEKQQHKCYFCNKELKETEAFEEKFVCHPALYYSNAQIKPEENSVILCEECSKKRSRNDIYLKFPHTGNLVDKKGRCAEKKDMAGGVVLALLFGWLGLFYSSKKYALIALGAWIILGILYAVILYEIPVLMIILGLLYAAGCVTASVLSIKKQHEMYDKCL